MYRINLVFFDNGQNMRIGIQQFQSALDVADAYTGILGIGFEFFDPVFYPKVQNISFDLDFDLHVRVSLVIRSVFEGVFDKRNQQQGFDEFVFGIAVNVDIDVFDIVQTQFLQLDIVLDVIDFLFQQNRFIVGFVKHVAHQFRQGDNGIGNQIRFFVCQRINAVQGIEQEMGIGLFSQINEFCRGSLRLHKHFVLLVTEIFCQYPDDSTDGNNQQVENCRCNFEKQRLLFFEHSIFDNFFSSCIKNFGTHHFLEFRHKIVCPNDHKKGYQNN